MQMAVVLVTKEGFYDDATVLFSPLLHGVIDSYSCMGHHGI